MSAQLLTYEGLLEIFRESDRRFNEKLEKQAAEFRQEMKERADEYAREMQELRQQTQKTELAVERASKIVGNLGNRIGDMIEHMIGERIVEKFQALGYAVTHPVRRNCSFANAKMAIAGEFDLTLVDTNVVILISVKLMQEAKDVSDFLEKIEEYRRHIDAVGFVQPPFKHLLPGTRFIGAIAGGVVDEKAMKLAHENGLHVIVQSGEAVDIMPTPEGFQAREW